MSEIKLEHLVKNVGKCVGKCVHRIRRKCQRTQKSPWETQPLDSLGGFEHDTK